MANDQELRAHQEWLGYLQPVGLVVSPPALHAAQAYVNRGEFVRLQATLADLVDPGPPPCINDFPGFCRTLLGWSDEHLAGAPDGPTLPESLDVSLPEYGEVLSPTYAVPDGDKDGQWLMLVQALPRTVDLDAVEKDRQDNDRAWHAGPQARFERLLREREVADRPPVERHAPAPRLRAARRVLGPPDVPGGGHARGGGPADPRRAPHAALGRARLQRPGARRSTASRRSSGTAASTRTRSRRSSPARCWPRSTSCSEASRPPTTPARASCSARSSSARPQDVYGGLLGTLMRLVFVLYAEERELLPSRDEVYAEHYSVSGLFDRLRDDNARFPDTMDQRYGAWARLLTLFRLIHDGARHGGLRLPARHGRLFDPDTWDFLEGRPYGDQLDRRHRIEPPRVPDGIVYRVLENLLVLDGERISYRALDVEQIGSVYEAMMGFELRMAQGPSIGVKPDHVVVDLADLLAAKPADRLKRLKDEASCDLSGAAGESWKAAQTPDDAVAALGKKASPHTPRLLPKGAMFLQPTDERRRSGSHYTPRSLTEPIVRTTLEPILKNLGEQPTAAQILDLKVCDPAMGSGAFLVEACRYLGDALVKAWETHGDKPQVPPDEDPLLYARRLVAQRCLYGVDKNPYAVDLAKLSLWLATLARDHPFTFLDHALRHGDSLVGLSRDQIASFSLGAEAEAPPAQRRPRAQPEARRGRAACRLLALGDTDDHAAKVKLLEDSERRPTSSARPPISSSPPSSPRRRTSSARPAARGTRDLLDACWETTRPPSDLDAEIAPLYQGPRPVHPFHWPRVPGGLLRGRTRASTRSSGNPPFAGKNTLIAGTREGYPRLARRRSTRSRTATPTWSPTSSAARSTCCARRHLRPHRHEHDRPGRHALDRPAVDLHARRHDLRRPQAREVARAGCRRNRQRRPRRPPSRGATTPPSSRGPDRRAEGSAIPAPVPARWPRRRPHHRLPVPRRRPRRPGAAGCQRRQELPGPIVLGMGFTFDDDNPDATPLAEMERLIAKDPRNPSASSRTSAARRSTTARPTRTTDTSSTSAR